MKDLFLKPRLSEQTYALAQTARTYVFDVPRDANKHSVARAVAAQFDVKVESVNMTTVKGKAKRTISLTGRRRGLADGTRSDVKKAYVKLVKGATLPVFAAIEETEAKEEKAQEQIDKAMTKQLQKEAGKLARSTGGNRVTRLFKKQGDK
jgi:large subunit ribosomal protein L23